MSDRKYLSARDLREQGFLLEANRQFFHPHGLALEVTRVAEGEGAPVRTFALSQALYDELLGILDVYPEPISEGLSAALDAAAVYHEGDAWISGVWDCRDDPEGVVMAGGFSEDEKARIANVAAERQRHRPAREKLFATKAEVMDREVAEYEARWDLGSLAASSFVPAGRAADVQPLDSEIPDA